MILKAVNTTASLLLLIFMGYLMGGVKRIRENHGDTIISYILANWALPCFIFNVVTSSFDSSSELLETFSQLPIPFLIMGVMLGLGLIVAKIFSISPSRTGAFMDANTFANTSFIGFPVIASLFGDQILSVGMIYYIANTLLFFSLGAWLLGRDTGTKEPIFSLESLKKVFSPMVLALLLGIIVKLVEVPIPGFVTSALSYFSSVCPFLGMIFVGMVIRQNKISAEYFFPDMLILLVLRYALTPLCIGLVLSLFPVSGGAKTVFFILALMPSNTQMSILSKENGGDYVFCALWMTVSSLVGMVVIPALIFLAENVFHFI